MIVNWGTAGCGATSVLTPLTPRQQSHCVRTSIMLTSLQHNSASIASSHSRQRGNVQSGLCPVCTRWRARCHGDRWSQGMNKANRAAHAMVKCGWNGVRELKKGSGWQTLKKNSLKCLRDDAMKLHQAHILSLTQQATNLDSTEKRRNRCHQARLHVFLSLPSLDGVTGSSLGTNPEDKLVLGRCLEPSTNIGPAMMAKMLKENGWCTHRTTL
jgi:hypothetical protein